MIIRISTIVASLAGLLVFTFYANSTDIFEELKATAERGAQFSTLRYRKSKLNCAIEIFDLEKFDAVQIIKMARSEIHKLSKPEIWVKNVGLDAKSCIETLEGKTEFVEAMNDPDALAWSIGKSREIAVASAAKKLMMFLRGE